VSEDRDLDPTTRGHPSVFAGVAGAYERARPGYPEEAVRWLAGDEPRDVVDLGAGTGKLSRALVALGHRVMAVEPLPQMLEHLAENAPGAFGVLGTAEVIPLPDAFADVVTCAQSFHWFDHELALPEIARVLRPEGRLALVWNIRDDDDVFTGRLSALIGNERLAEGAGYGPLEASDLFREIESAEFRHDQVVDRETLLDLVLSRSHCAKLEPEVRAPVLEAVGRLYDEAAGPDGAVLPYVTYCYRAAKAA
jgi:SAM-dependent methyltransferase